MKTLSALALVAALMVAGCGQGQKTEGGEDLTSARERSKIIPPGPTGPVYATTGTVQAADLKSVTLDHEGVAEAGLAAGRTTFKTWADVIASPPGEPGARVAVKVQKLGDGWAVVEMTGR